MPWLSAANSVPPQCLTFLASLSIIHLIILFALFGHRSCIHLFIKSEKKKIVQFDLKFNCHAYLTRLGRFYCWLCTKLFWNCFARNWIVICVYQTQCSLPTVFILFYFIFISIFFLVIHVSFNSALNCSDAHSTGFYQTKFTYSICNRIDFCYALQCASAFFFLSVESVD